MTVIIYEFFKDPCNNPISINDTTRSVYYNANEFDILCDRNQFNHSWYRFNGGYNSQMMRAGKVSMIKCGTISPGWLVGHHPAGKNKHIKLLEIYPKL